MRSLILSFWLAAVSITPADAAKTVTDISPTCFKNAASFAQKISEPGHYDEGGFKTLDCGWTSDKNVILCTVSASKATGAALDLYHVILNPTCSKALRIELAFEE